MTNQTKNDVQLDGLDKIIAETLEFDVDAMKSLRNRARNLLQSHISGSFIPEMDETGWIMAGNENHFPSGNSRQDINNQAWYYYHTSPMLNHAATIHNNYTFGQGATLVVNDQDNEDLRTIVQNFWNSTSSRNTVSRAQAQYKLNLKRICDGEIFFLLIVDKLTGKVTTDFIDPRQVKHIITENGVPHYYMVVVKNREFDFSNGRYKEAKEKKVFIPDYRVAKPDMTKANYHDGLGLSSEQEAFVLHAMFNDYGGRGLSAFATAIPWLRAFTGFMEDRITIQLAIATFAFKMKLKGGSNTLNRLMSQYSEYNRSMDRYSEAPTAERAMGGATWFENDHVTLEKMDMDTGAGSAYTDARLIRQMVGIGTQLMEHYITGDPSFANLATATAMELPLLKTFEAIQQFWSDTYQDIIRFVTYTNLRLKQLSSKYAKLETDATGYWDITPNKPKGSERPYDLSTTLRFPPIITRDATTWLTAINGLLGTMSTRGEDVLPLRPIAITVLELMGLEDAESIYDEFVEDMETEDEPEPVEPPEPVDDDGTDDELFQSDPQAGETASSNGNGFNHPLIVHPQIVHTEIYERSSHNPNVVYTDNATVSGEPLDDDEATDVPPFTESEMEDELEDWLELPELQKLLDDLDISESELEDT